MLFNEKHRLSWRLCLLLVLATSAYDYDYDYARSGGADGGALEHHPAPATLVVNRSSLDNRLDRAAAVAYDAYSH